MHHFDVDSLTAGRWLNGGGATREIASRPVGSGAFGWRASVADIDRDGPFSAFPGVDRTLTLLAGDGVRLVCPGEFDQALVRAGEPFRFSGDLSLTAELPGGACRVLNIMVRRGRWTARVERVVGSVVPPAGNSGVLYVLSGRWQAGAGGHVLVPGQGTWWDGDPSDGGSSDADPSDADPSDADPSDADPSDADPSDADPSDADPSDADASGGAVVAPLSPGAAALWADIAPAPVG